MSDPVPSSLRKDVITAYFATGAKVLSWVVVTAVVYRRLGADYFAILALVRTTIGLLNYTTLGLAPAMIRLLSLESAPRAVLPMENADALEYATPRRVEGRGSQVYSSAIALAGFSAIVGTALAVLYGRFFSDLHRTPMYIGFLSYFAFLMAMGAVFRLVSDVGGAVLQVRGRIKVDNLLLATTELVWVGLTLAAVPSHRDPDALIPVGIAWVTAGAFLLIARIVTANHVMGGNAFRAQAIRGPLIRQLLAFGLLVALAQAADFLYAPTDNILINRFINPETVAVYAPAIQIDAGLLLLVSGLASVLLPHAALAHGAGDARAVRRYYIVGTLASAGMLLVAGVLVWLLSPILFRLWLHDPMTATQAILPLILIHTVVGGSSGVGRSILLAIGKVRPFTTAVLVAGASNVLLSFAFVRFFGLGLTGIVLGTIIAVVGRCAVWMPWYVMRELGGRGEKSGEGKSESRIQNPEVESENSRLG